MITSIEITRFRGIREGKLEDLTPLTVLVGPNGCGKSSALDALLIGGTRVPGEAVGRAVSRHEGVQLGAPWLLWRKGFQGPARIVTSEGRAVNTDKGTRPYVRETELFLPEGEKEGRVVHMSLSDNNSFGKTFRNQKVRIDFEPGNRYQVSSGAFCLMSEEQLPGTSLVETPRTNGDVPLYKLVNKAREQGLLGSVTEILRGVLPAVKELAIGAEGDRPRADVDFGDRAVPVALCGDGIHALVALSLELATYPKGAVLIEEPEVHQHPAAIRQSVRAILAATRREIQVILTTHSLELIDCLLAELSGDEYVHLSVHRLQLENGALKSHRVAGPDVQFARTEIGDDLR